MVRNRAMPRCARALIVPSGSSSFSAISTWVRPSKKARRRTCRCSSESWPMRGADFAGALVGVRIFARRTCVAEPAGSSSGALASSNSPRRRRDRMRSIARLRTSATTHEKAEPRSGRKPGALFQTERKTSWRRSFASASLAEHLDRERIERGGEAIVERGERGAVPPGHARDQAGIVIRFGAGMRRGLHECGSICRKERAIPNPIAWAEELADRCESEGGNKHGIAETAPRLLASRTGACLRFGGRRGRGVR